MLSMLKTKDSEVQLHATKADEQRKRAEAEANKSQTLNAQVSTFSQTETELRSQLNIYVEKFKQVSCGVLCSSPRFCAPISKPQGLIKFV